MPGTRHRYTAKFRRCVRKVARKGSAANPYAVCQATFKKSGRKIYNR
jgi:hypothetical protein